MKQKTLFSVNKTLTAVLLCLLMFTATVLGSSESDRQPRKGDLVITYDFETGNMTTNITSNGLYLYEVKARHNVTFKIINMNRFVYTATIVWKAIENYTTPPDPFKSPFKVEGLEALKESKVELKKCIEKLSVIKTLPEKLKKILYESSKIDRLHDKKRKLYSSLNDPLGISASVSDIDLITECKNILANAKNVLKEKKKLYSNSIPSSECSDISNLEYLLKEFIKKDYIDDIGKVLYHFDDRSFSVSHLLPCVKGDGLEVTVKFEPIDKENSKVPHPIDGPVEVTVKGGWKLDFSTGFFFNLNAQNRSYRFDNDSSDVNKVILRKNNPEGTTINPVIGAMLHVYPRQNRGIKWSGISFGLSGSEVENLSYYLGTGLMFGAKKRLIINAGGVLTKFKYLKSDFSYMLNQPMEKNTDLKPEDMTESVYKLRFFVGLTYNL